MPCVRQVAPNKIRDKVRDKYGDKRVDDMIGTSHIPRFKFHTPHIPYSTERLVYAPHDWHTSYSEILYSILPVRLLYASHVRHKSYSEIPFPYSEIPFHIQRINFRSPCSRIGACHIPCLALGLAAYLLLLPWAHEDVRDGKHGRDGQHLVGALEGRGHCQHLGQLWVQRELRHQASGRRQVAVVV